MNSGGKGLIGAELTGPCGHLLYCPSSILVAYLKAFVCCSALTELLKIIRFEHLILTEYFLQNMPNLRDCPIYLAIYLALLSTSIWVIYLIILIALCNKLMPSYCTLIVGYIYLTIIGLYFYGKIDKFLYVLNKYCKKYFNSLSFLTLYLTLLTYPLLIFQQLYPFPFNRDKISSFLIRVLKFHDFYLDNTIYKMT